MTISPAKHPTQHPVRQRACLLVLAIATCIPWVGAMAQPPSAQSAALGTCLADNTTGRERKEMAKWFFVAMSAHPEIKDLSRADATVRDQTQKRMGTLFTRLLTEDCREPARRAAQQEGSEAIKHAFGTLGQLAMQELLADPEVAATLSGFERHIDRQKMDAALSGR